MACRAPCLCIEDFPPPAFFVADISGIGFRAAKALQACGDGLVQNRLQASPSRMRRGLPPQAVTLSVMQRSTMRRSMA